MFEFRPLCYTELLCLDKYSIWSSVSTKLQGPVFSKVRKIRVRFFEGLGLSSSPLCKNGHVRFTFNEETNYFEENTSINGDFCSTIFQPFQFELEQKKRCGNKNHEKGTNYIYVSAADLHAFFKSSSFFNSSVFLTFH